MAKELKELTPRSVNYSQWYQDLVIKADLAENSAVRGCMVIKPYGYAIWEKMQRDVYKRQDPESHVYRRSVALGYGRINNNHVRHRCNGRNLGLPDKCHHTSGIDVYKRQKV